MKKKKLLSFVLSLCLLLSCAVTLVACGGNKEDNALRESLSWYKDYSTARELLNDASKNYTLEVKEISSFEMDDTWVEINSYTHHYDYTPKNVTYASDTMYKLTVENDAFLFDAGDKLDSKNKSFSTASELYLDEGSLKYNVYEKTNNSWAIKANEHDTSFYAVIEENNAVKNSYDLAETYFGTVCDRVLNNLHEKTYGENMEDLDAFLCFYDKDSKTFKFNTAFDGVDYCRAQDVREYYGFQINGLDGENKYKLILDNSFVILNKREGYNYYTLDRLGGTFYLQNIEFKLDGEKITSLSYDIYVQDLYSDELSNGQGGYEFTNGYHFEYTNFGSSKVNLNSDVQASRSAYSGVIPTEEMLTAAKTFYTGGNFTVSYKADFCISNNLNMEYELELKITDNAISRHLVTYQPASGGNDAQTIIEDTITIKENGVWVEYYRNGGEDGVWNRTVKGANDQYDEEDLLGTAEIFWDNIEDAHDTITELEIKGEYSDTLKSYVYNGGRKGLIKEENYGGRVTEKTNYVSTIGDGINGEHVLTDPSDAVYTFGENGLSSYLVRYGFKYKPASATSSSTYAEGMLFKNVSNIGTTTITAPADFINSAE